MRILILGASSGLGRGIAETYIGRGHTVGIAGRRTDKLEELAAGRDNVFCTACDVTDLATAVPALKALVERMGGMDLMVHCSGIGRQNPALDFAIELPTVDTNVRGWTAVVDWAFSYFTAQGHGHLAAISSFASLRGLAPAPAYAASKAYQAHYLEALRQRALASHKPLYVTDIRPGFVDTPLLSDPSQFFWVERPERAVRAIVRAIDRRRGVATVPWRWALLAKLMPLVPTRLMARIIG